MFSNAAGAFSFVIGEASILDCDNSIILDEKVVEKERMAGAAEA